MTTKETIIREAVEEFLNTEIDLHHIQYGNTIHSSFRIEGKSAEDWLTSTLHKVYDAAQDEKMVWLNKEIEEVNKILRENAIGSGFQSEYTITLPNTN